MSTTTTGTTTNATREQQTVTIRYALTIPHPSGNGERATPQRGFGAYCDTPEEIVDIAKRCLDYTTGVQVHVIRVVETVREVAVIEAERATVDHVRTLTRELLEDAETTATRSLSRRMFAAR